MKLIRKILVIPLFITLSSYAGKGLDQIEGLTLLGEARGFDYSGLAELGSNVVERCKSDPAYLDKLCLISQADALNGNGMSAVSLALTMYEHAPERIKKFLLDLVGEGDTDAMILLAELYYESDEESAVKLLHKAYQKGDQYAATLLMVKYKSSFSEVDFLKFVNQQADKKNKYALMELAIMELEKVKDDKYPPRAFEMVTKAWDAGLTKAAFPLSIMYKKMGNEELASEWMEKGAAAGDELAQYKLGMLLLEGDLKSSKEDGLRWIKLSAEGGNCSAQTKMGKILYQRALC